MITAIVLAGGASSRMGRPKPLLRLGDRPLLEHVVSNVRASSVDEIVVVLGHESERIRREVALDGTVAVENPAFARGMSTSIRAGLEAADPRADAFLIVLGDQPFVSSNTVDRLIEARKDTGAKIVVPTFHGQRGNPVLLDASLSPDMRAITGDVGCRAIFPDHREQLVEVPVEDPGILVDLDTPEQWERIERARSEGEPLEALLPEIVGLPIHLHRPRREDQRRPRRRTADVLALAEELRSRGEPFVLATVVRIERPTSGKPGYKAIVRSNREVIGWVGGSCAESVLLAESLAALRDGRPRLVRLSRDAGGGPSEEGVVEYVMECHSGGAMDLYIEPNLPKPQLLIVGDSPVSEALMALGRLLDYRVVAVVPGARSDSLPDADSVVDSLDRIPALVTEDTYAAVATMGKYDEAALRLLAPSAAAYVGLVASRRRAFAVLQELRGAGLDPASVDRIRSPAGLDISAKTPEEIALSILAEVTSLRRSAPPREVAVAEPRPAAVPLALDVVCGMEVSPDSPHRVDHRGRAYVFCSETCRDRFLATPEAFLA